MSLGQFHRNTYAYVLQDICAPHHSLDCTRPMARGCAFSGEASPQSVKTLCVATVGGTLRFWRCASNTTGAARFDADGIPNPPPHNQPNHLTWA